MRWLVVGSVVAYMLAGGAEAAPARWMPPAATALPLEQVRWTCNQFRCLDQWTGNQTASFCDERGCHPAREFGGGRGPRYGYGAPPPPPRFGDRYGYAPPPPPPGYGYAPPQPGYGYEDD